MPLKLTKLGKNRYSVSLMLLLGVYASCCCKVLDVNQTMTMIHLSSPVSLRYSPHQQGAKGQRLTGMDKP